MSVPKLPKIIKWKARYYCEGIVIATTTLKAKTENEAKKEAQDHIFKHCDAIEIKPNIKGESWHSIWADE